MSREDIQALQLEKFQALLTKIYGHNRFYTARMNDSRALPKDIRSLGDLVHLKLTTKSDLIQAQDDHPPLGTNATFPETAYTRIHQTSGTTGSPLRVLDTQESWDWWAKCWGYVMAGTGLTKEDRVFIPFSFGPFLGFWAAVEGARKIGAMMIPGGGRDSLQRLHVMRELAVTAICCTPTYALRLAEVARDEGFDLSEIPVRRTIHTGEPGANIEHTKAQRQNRIT